MNVRVLRQPLLVLALMSAAVTAPSSARAETQGSAPSGEKAILADFVEITSRQVMRRDAALIELINMSPVTLDVSVGEGATTLKPGERMLAGVQPGSVPVKVIAQGVSTAPLEGDLQIEGGRHYELAFAYDRIPEREQAVSEGVQAPSPASADGQAATPPSGAQPVKAAPTSQPRKEKVSVGRRRH